MLGRHSLTVNMLIFVKYCHGDAFLFMLMHKLKQKAQEAGK